MAAKKKLPGVSPKLLARAKNIRLLAMDVDGVLTAGEIIVLESGEEVKLWSVKDRMGFFMLQKSELPVKLAWITARESRQVQLRAQELGIHFLVQKSPDKWKSLQDCAFSLGVDKSQIAYVGDDLVDLRCLKNVGLAVCPPESPQALKEACHYETRAPAGKGVVREVIELLIRAQGRWEKVISHFACFLLCALLLGLSACTREVPPQVLAEKPDQWIEKFTITETNRGLPVWVLNSAIAQIYNKRKKATLDDIHIQFMNQDGDKRTTPYKDLSQAKKSQTQAAYLTAPKGEVKLNNHNLSVWGGVQVLSQDGTVLLTDRLMYSTTQQKILTDSPVKIVRGDSIVIGEGLEATPDLSTVKIFRHEASIYPKKVQIQ